MTRPTRLTLLCHAATDAQRAAAFPLDEPIDAKGRAAAAALGGEFSDLRTIVCSPAARAVQTAAAAGLSARPEPALRDCDHGRWAGRRLDEIARCEPEAVAQWLADPDAAPHGGEAISALLRRVADWMESGALVGPALAITHAAVIRAAIIHALDAPALSFWRIDAPPLTTVELRHDGRRWALRAGPLPARALRARGPESIR